MTVEYLSGGTHCFVLVESLDMDGRNLTTIVQSSTDLNTWSEVADLNLTSSVRDNPAGVRTRTLTRPAVGEGPFFYRLITIMAPSN